jgi:hypothetical protein
MAITNEAFSKYKETRALSGYKSAWLVKHPDDATEKYSLIGATETAPYVFGSKNTFEIDLLQASNIGQVEGKPTLEAQDVEVLHHRDNAYRFGKLKGQTLDFMTINAEFVGYKFSGTLDYRPNNAEADVNRATVTITPMSAEAEPVLNARPEIIETLCFKSAIPESIKVGETIDLSVVQSSAVVTTTIKKIADGTNAETDATNAFTITSNIATATATGLYAIKVSASGYAPWVTTVYVEA